MPLMDFRKVLDKMRASRKPLIGAFVTSIDPATTTILGSVGFDYVIMDCEHGPMSRETVLNHVRAAQAVGMIPMVRVLESNPRVIQSYLDLGVQMVKVPHVGTAEEASRAARMIRYEPGGRGMCYGCHAGSYSFDGWQDHVKHSNQNVFVSPSLESMSAIGNLDAILAIDDIEIIGFSPGDLSQDLGIEFRNNSPQLIKIWKTVRDRVHEAGKLIIVPGGRGFEGADLITHGMDLGMLQREAARVLANERKVSSAMREAN